MMQIVYDYGDKVYLNITNRCPCACDFCVRRNTDDMGTGESLWLDHQPDFAEVKAAVDRHGIAPGQEVVFCGFGEPTEALDLLLETARYLKKTVPGVRVRVNTNGLSDLINGETGTAKKLAGLVDKVSISLNASNARDYCAIVHPKFGERSFEAMLSFAEDCRGVIPQVTLSVVDVIGEQEVEACRKLCAARGLTLRVRKYIA